MSDSLNCMCRSQFLRRSRRRHCMCQSLVFCVIASSFSCPSLAQTCSASDGGEDCKIALEPSAQEVAAQQIMDELEQLQNPTVCKGRQLLVLDLKQWFDPLEGLGFRITILTAALAEGYYRNRTVVFGNRTHAAWWEQFFQPISRCRLRDGKRSKSKRIHGDKGLALFVLPKHYRHMADQIPAKLFGAIIMKFALRLQPWLQEAVDKDASCYGVRQPGVVTMHVRRGDNTNFADKAFFRLSSYFDMIKETSSEEGRRVFICSDSRIDVSDEVTLDQRARWPNVTLVGKEGNCSRHQFADAALGKRVHSDLKDLTVTSEAIRDLYLLSEGDIFIGLGSSHFATTAALLRFARSPKVDIVRERFVDSRELAKGISPLGLLPISNWPDGPDETGPAGAHRFREIGVRFALVSECDEHYLVPKRKKKSKPIVSFDEKLHTTVMSHEAFDRALSCTAWQ